MIIDQGRDDEDEDGNASCCSNLIVFGNPLKIFQYEILDVFLDGRQLIEFRDVGELEAIIDVNL